MPTTPEERLTLIRHINGLVFEEYPAVAAAWLKVVGWQELRGCVPRNEDPELVDRYLQSEAVAFDSQREMIRLFLREWLVSQVPENIGVWGLEVAEFRAIPRSDALAAADRIVAASQGTHEAEAPHAGARAMLAAMRGGRRTTDEPEIPAPQLRSWFADELFADPRCAFFLHDSPGGPTVRFNLANPRLVGLAPDLIGMFWLE